MLNENQILALAQNTSDPTEFLGKLKMDYDVNAEFFYSVGSLLNHASITKHALRSFFESRKLFQNDENQIGEAKCYSSIGICYRKLDDYTKAIEFHNLALNVFSEINDIDGIFSCYINLGNCYSSKGNFMKSIEIGNEAIAFLDTISQLNEKGREAIFATIYRNLGLAYRNLGKIEVAFKFLNKSLLLAKEAKDNAGILHTFVNLANVYSDKGKPQKSIEFSLKALELNNLVKDSAIESTAYMNLGNAYRTLGDFRKSIQYYEQALPIARKIGLRAVESRCLANLSNVYNYVDASKMNQLHDTAIEYASQSGDKSLQSHLLLDKAILYAKTKEHDKALNFLNQGLEFAKNDGNKRLLFSALVKAGLVHHLSGETHQAVDFFQQALNMNNDDIQDLENKLQSLTAISDCYYYLGEYEKSITYGDKALQLAREIGNPQFMQIILYNLGKTYSKLDPYLAKNYFEQSVNLIELIGLSLFEEQFKINFFSDLSHVYSDLIQLCIKLNEFEEAFMYLQKSKAKAFLDSLSLSEMKPTAPKSKILNSLLEKEKEVLTELRKIKVIDVSQNSNALPDVNEHLKTLDDIYSQLNKIDPQYVSIRHPTPISLSELKEISKTENLIIIEYALFEKNLIIFLINSSDFIVKNIKISHSINDLLQQLSKQGPSYIHEINQDILDECSECFISPIESKLQENKLICFNPSGILHYFPFHILKSKKIPIWLLSLKN